MAKKHLPSAARRLPALAVGLVAVRAFVTYGQAARQRGALPRDVRGGPGNVAGDEKNGLLGAGSHALTMPYNPPDLKLVPP